MLFGNPIKILSFHKMNNHPHIIFFDGYCNLCSGVVQFIIKKEKTNTFKFASLQSDIAKEILSTASKKIKNADSIIYYKNGKFYYKSSAALQLALMLQYPWPLAFVFWIVPFFIRDFFYDIVAKYRYKWFGKKDACMLPTPQLKAKFLD